MLRPTPQLCIKKKLMKAMALEKSVEKFLVLLSATVSTARLAQSDRASDFYNCISEGCEFDPRGGLKDCAEGNFSTAFFEHLLEKSDYIYLCLRARSIGSLCSPRRSVQFRSTSERQAGNLCCTLRRCRTRPTPAPPVACMCAGKRTPKVSIIVHMTMHVRVGT